MFKNYKEQVEILMKQLRDFHRQIIDALTERNVALIENERLNTKLTVQELSIKALTERNQELEKIAGDAVTAKDEAYTERNKTVAGLAHLALGLGLKAGLGKHVTKEGEEWDADWMNIVFIDLPSGQVSWHIHDSELERFGFLPRYEGKWDGHTTAEKYMRVIHPQLHQLHFERRRFEMFSVTTAQEAETVHRVLRPQTQSEGPTAPFPITESTSLMPPGMEDEDLLLEQAMNRPTPEAPRVRVIPQGAVSVSNPNADLGLPPTNRNDLSGFEYNPEFAPHP